MGSFPSPPPASAPAFRRGGFLCTGHVWPPPATSLATPRLHRHNTPPASRPQSVAHQARPLHLIHHAHPSERDDRLYTGLLQTPSRSPHSARRSPFGCSLPRAIALTTPSPSSLLPVLAHRPSEPCTDAPETAATRLQGRIPKAATRSSALTAEGGAAVRGSPVLKNTLTTRSSLDAEAEPASRQASDQVCQRRHPQI